MQNRVKHLLPPEGPKSETDPAEKVITAEIHSCAVPPLLHCVTEYRSWVERWPDAESCKNARLIVCDMILGAFGVPQVDGGYTLAANRSFWTLLFPVIPAMVSAEILDHPGSSIPPEACLFLGMFIGQICLIARRESGMPDHHMDALEKEARKRPLELLTHYASVHHAPAWTPTEEGYRE